MLTKSFVEGYLAMQLGIIAVKIFDETGTLIPNTGETFFVVGVLVALVMWEFGLMWLFFALASIARSRFPFNIGWWAFTFPIGIYTFLEARNMPECVVQRIWAMGCKVFFE